MDFQIAIWVHLWNQWTWRNVRVIKIVGQTSLHQYQLEIGKFRFPRSRLVSRTSISFSRFRYKIQLFQSNLRGSKFQKSRKIGKVCIFYLTLALCLLVRRLHSREKISTPVLEADKMQLYCLTIPIEIKQLKSLIKKYSSEDGLRGSLPVVCNET